MISYDFILTLKLENEITNTLQPNLFIKFTIQNGALCYSQAREGGMLGKEGCGVYLFFKTPLNEKY